MFAKRYSQLTYREMDKRKIMDMAIGAACCFALLSLSFFSGLLNNFVYIILFIILLIYIAYCQASYNRAVNLLLEEQVNLTEYRQYVYGRVINEKSPFSVHFNHIIRGQLEFLEGSFEQAFQELHAVCYASTNRLVSDKLNLTGLSLLATVCVFLNKEEDYKKACSSIESLNHIDEETKKDSIRRLEGIHDIIVNHAKSNLYSESPPVNKLSAVFSNYYKAKAAKDKETARKYFSKIANEHEKLFVVQEAKKYLEENKNGETATAHWNNSEGRE